MTIAANQAIIAGNIARKDSVVYLPQALHQLEKYPPQEYVVGYPSLPLGSFKILGNYYGITDTMVQDEIRRTGYDSDQKRIEAYKKLLRTFVGVNPV
jgi:hypothetical protein